MDKENVLGEKIKLYYERTGATQRVSCFARATHFSNRALES